MLERIRRCKHCGAAMMSVKPQEWSENPFCLVCLPTRFEAVKRQRESVSFELRMGYVIATSTAQKSPTDEVLLRRK